MVLVTLHDIVVGGACSNMECLRPQNSQHNEHKNYQANQIASVAVV